MHDFETRARARALGVALVACSWTVAPVAARATVVNGQVRTTTGTGIADVDIDFIDRATGTSIPLTGDRTDVLGFYAVDVPPGGYDVRFEPAPGDRHRGVEVGGVVVAGTPVLLDQVLEEGWLLSVRLVDEGGLPVSGADIDVLTSPAWTPVFTANDRTDAQGRATVVVPTGTYRVDFVPSAMASLFPLTLEPVGVAADTDLGDRLMETGFHLSGRVVGADGMPVEGARLTFVDPATHDVILDPNRRTIPGGLFDLFLSPSEYAVRFAPPVATPYRPRVVAGIELAGDSDLGDVVLDVGVMAEGFVEDTARLRIEGVDLDFRDSWSGLKRLTPKDNTDLTGFYAVPVPPGTYDVGFEPPLGSGLASVELLGVVLEADSVLPTVQLPAGFTVTARVVDGGGRPIADVDLDAIDTGTGLEVPTPTDDTDATGNLSTILAAGTYDLELMPPEGSGVGRVLLADVVVSGNLALGDIVLPASVTASARSVSPVMGPTAGGTLLTVSGGSLEPGVRVRVGGRTLSQVTRLDATMAQGVTKPRHAGTVDVEVVNPGAQPVVLPTAFTYVESAEPLLMLSLGGPVQTDVLLEWSDVGRPRYQVFRSTDPRVFGDAERLHATGGSSYRDDGGAAVDGLTFYVVE